MTLKLRNSSWICVAALAMASACAAQDARPTPQQDKPEAPILGGVKILPDKKGLELTGTVCLQKGLLDFVAVKTGGREYESALALDVHPSALHASLLAIGAKPGPTETFLKWRRLRDEQEGKKTD